MVSAGLLLLLLMSTSLVLSSPSAHLSTSLQHDRSLQKRVEKMKSFLTAMEYTDKIAKALSPFIGLIPVAGEYINLFLTIPTTIAENTKKDETMAFLKVQFQNLNEKIDRYHTQDNWKSLTNIYQNYENDIKSAWKQFETLVKGLKTAEKEKNIKVFKKTFGMDCIRSTQKLHNSLTSRQTSFNTDFGKTLIEFSRCHEKIIKDFTILIAELFYTGITISHFIYQNDGINQTEELAKMAHESGSVMYEIHKYCIINTDKHIRLDVKELIDVNKDRKQLAKDIRLFLEKEFDRYDWMVVAFLTENSNHDIIESFNRHTLSGAFIREEKGEVTVAVAKQLKGTHSKAAEVTKAIEKCFAKEQPDCHDVIKQLESCKEIVGPLKLKDTYTAVHAFISESHESVAALEAKEAPEKHTGLSNQLSVPYIYTGKCKKYKIFSDGQFRVLIKSDEEMMRKPPCDKLHCGEKGKCVVLENTLIPVCECDKQHGFYGENCEESAEGYKNYMLGKKRF